MKRELFLTAGVIFAVVLSFSLGGCSLFKHDEDSASTDGATVQTDPNAQTDAVPQATAENQDPFASPEQQSAPIAEASQTPSEPPVAQAEQPVVQQEPVTPPAEPVVEQKPQQPLAVEEPKQPVSDSLAATAPAEDYSVQGGDTLMKIAFEVYGDVYQWRKIFEMNKDKISDPNRVPKGVVLRVEKNAMPAAVARNGESYTIKQNDTLGTISTDIYGTPKKWRKIWENNKQLIKNPNRIFAGFSIYYTMTPEERQEANQLKQTPMASSQKVNDSVSQAQANIQAGGVDRQPASVTGSAPVAQPVGSSAH